MTPGVLSAVSATGQYLIRLDDGMYLKREGVLSRLPDGTSMDALLRQPLDELRRFLGQDRPAASLQDGAVLEAPIESQEVWAAGVTYQRSLQARADEAVSSDPYDPVYTAERPEIFFKATAGRVRGPGQAVYIRSDSTWDVPEPELAVICNSRVEVVGYTIGNDMSSRIRFICRRRRYSMDAVRLGRRSHWRGTFRRRIGRSSWTSAGMPRSSTAPRRQHLR